MSILSKVSAYHDNGSTFQALLYLGGEWCNAQRTNPIKLRLNPLKSTNFHGRILKVSLIWSGRFGLVLLIENTAQHNSYLRLNRLQMETNFLLYYLFGYLLITITSKSRRRNKIKVKLMRKFPENQISWVNRYYWDQSISRSISFSWRCLLMVYQSSFNIVNGASSLVNLFLQVTRKAWVTLA